MSDFHTPVPFQLVFAPRLRPDPSSVMISSADDAMTDRLQLVYLFDLREFSVLYTCDQWNRFRGYRISGFVSRLPTPHCASRSHLEVYKQTVHSSLYKGPDPPI